MYAVVRVALLPLQEAGDNNQFCWRNLFSCINLLRILNKLTKWKHSRTMVRGCPLPMRPSSISPGAHPWLYTAGSAWPCAQGFLWKCWSFFSSSSSLFSFTDWALNAEILFLLQITLFLWPSSPVQKVLAVLNAPVLPPGGLWCTRRRCWCPNWPRQRLCGSPSTLH